jgi:hypothetical protein
LHRLTVSHRAAAASSTPRWPTTPPLEGTIAFQTLERIKRVGARRAEVKAIAHRLAVGCFPQTRSVVRFQFKHSQKEIARADGPTVSDQSQCCGNRTGRFESRGRIAGDVWCIYSTLCSRVAACCFGVSNRFRIVFSPHLRLPPSVFDRQAPLIATRQLSDSPCSATTRARPVSAAALAIAR